VTRAIAVAAAAVGLLGAGASGPTADVAIPGKLYSPSDLSVLTGTTVTWRNGDATTHTVTAEDDSFDSGYIPPGGTFAETFSKPGTYRFYCSIHRFMRGVVRVYSVVLIGPAHQPPVGAAVVLSGLVPDGTTDVVLERAAAAGRWETVAQAPPAAGGVYSFRTVADAPGVFRTRAGDVVSPLLALRPEPFVAVRRSGRALDVATQPVRPGSRVVLQAYDRERFAFRPVRAARLDATGRTRFLAGVSGHLRVVVRGDHGWSDGTSRVLLVR
jgi:plastocyanin